MNQTVNYLRIESTGNSEPILIAQTFTFESEHLSQVSRMDTMVTEVNTARFLLAHKATKARNDRAEPMADASFISWPAADATETARRHCRAGSPLHIAKVELTDPRANRPTRVGFKKSESRWLVSISS